MNIVERVKPFSAPQTSPGASRGFAVEARVRALLAAPAPREWRPTGLDRNAYLDLAERIVTGARDWVDAEGRVIDPILHAEMGQTTPRFAAPGAILLHFGRAPEIRDAVFRSMDYCCRTLPAGLARKNSPDFWMRELATAYLALESVASPGQLKRWAAGLSAVEPEKIYTRVSPDGSDLARMGNWAIYAAGGEAMREAAGLKPEREILWGNAFYDRYVGAQLDLFTENGMYRDPGDPITYDVTTRLQAACGLAFGYAGKHRAAVDEILRRGGLTTLLFASPEGFCPYGGRSAAFNFREAILAALCELEARRYKTSDPRLAGAFKRQAHLSTLAAQRWLLNMTPWRHIKNGFAPATRHGIDSYGNYAVYSLLAASFMALAAVFADDSIAEAPCPAEIGGFAFELAPAFHKVFAHCQGTYLEIDTAADPHYDATGLGCFALKGVPLELALGMPFPAFVEKWGAPSIVMAPGCTPPPAPVAIGPSWASGDAWVSLAGLSEGLTSRCRVVKESPDAVEFEIAYAHQTITLVEEYRLERGKVTIRSRASGNDKPVSRIRFSVPLLVSDGLSQSDIQGPDRGRALVRYCGCTYEIRFDEKVSAAITGEPFANRNGVYRLLVLEHAGSEIQVALTLGSDVRPGGRARPDSGL